MQINTEGYNPKYQHEILDAELISFTPTSKHKKWRTAYVQMRYQGIENWFMINEHEDTPQRLSNIHKLGYQYKIGDRFDFKFEIVSSLNKSNKLKIKSMLLKF